MNKDGYGMSWRARARGFKKKREINRRGRGLKKKKLICETKKKTWNKGKTGKIADYNFLPFGGEINCDYQISYNHCVINHRI